jgi:hypothetical protein
MPRIADSGFDAAVDDREDHVEPTVVVEGEQAHEQPEAAPTLDFHWSKKCRKVRAAAKGYSEQTHADY